MKELEELRNFKKETQSIDFSYENILRTMHMVYITRDILKQNIPIPNKEIALHQVNKIIDENINQVIYSNNENEIKESFTLLQKSYLIALDYFN